MSNLKLHILEASKGLISFQNVIEDAFNETIKKVSAKVTLPDIDIVIDDDSESTVPEIGVGGISPSAHLLYVHIDTGFKHTHETLKRELESTLAHELHHCARWMSVGYGKTLLEAMISEGLADHFDIEINGGEPKPWSVAIDDEEFDGLLKMAQPEFSNQEYNHRAWFFGSDDIQRWSGYSLGFSLVDRYIDKSGKSASQLVDVTAEEFIK